jgi:putative hydrolase of HD superfamily
MWINEPLIPLTFTLPPTLMGAGIVGDITPHDGVSQADKFSLEQAAVEQLREALGGTAAPAAAALEELWREYEDATSPEACLVKDFDKLEMILQASEYEGAQGMSLQEFFDSTAGKWRTELGRAWAEEVYRRRAARQQGQQGQQEAGSGT